MYRTRLYTKRGTSIKGKNYAQTELLQIKSLKRQWLRWWNGK